MNFREKIFLATGWLLVMILLISACAPRTTTIGLNAEELALIAAEIEHNPDAYEEILDRHDLDPREFEQAIREVAEDPDMARKYSEIYREKIETSN